MLVLPVDEATWAFRACLYVGVALLALDIVLPRMFRNRVRFVLPARPRRLHLPCAHPLQAEHFRRQKRDLVRQIRELERKKRGDSDADTSARGSESESTRSHANMPEKTKATKTRVVMAGDRSETDGKSQVAASKRVFRPRKRVSFDMARHEFDESRREVQQTPDKIPAATPVAVAHPTQRDLSADAAAPVDENGSVPSASAASAPPEILASRPDPFSLVDDDFPWQLPSYTRLGVSAARVAPSQASTVARPSSPLTHAQPRSAPEGPQGITLNVRRPVGNFNYGASAVTTLNPTGGLELKHKPLWRRSPNKQDLTTINGLVSGSLGLSHQANAISGGEAAATRSSLDAWSSTQAVAFVRSAASAAVPTQESQLLFRPDSLRSSPARTGGSNPFLSQRWRVPSPKPPLHTRQATAPAAVAESSSHVSTPLAQQSKLRTPKIIRRIAFDEDMMGALATPSDVSPFVTDSTRKRQRENDVQDALDAVGLPWHKRRPTSR